MIPYENAKSGMAARDEITKLLRKFGCESVGFMDDFDDNTVILAFKHHGRGVQLRASAKGWAALFLKEKPWSSRKRKRRLDYEQDALRQGIVSVNSILRDWVKGQVTAVECGMIPFEAVFMAHTITNDGRPLYERVSSMNLLPPPEAARG